MIKNIRERINAKFDKCLKQELEGKKPYLNSNWLDADEAKNLCYKSGSTFMKGLKSFDTFTNNIADLIDNHDKVNEAKETWSDKQRGLVLLPVDEVENEDDTYSRITAEIERKQAISDYAEVKGKLILTYQALTDQLLELHECQKVLDENGWDYEDGDEELL